MADRPAVSDRARTTGRPGVVAGSGSGDEGRAGDPGGAVFWSDQVAASVTGAQVVNDSKTPSGRAHIGALRGVLVHDALFRSVQQAGLPVTYRFGSDDMDPLDELSPGLEDFLAPHMGKPLCAVPAPPGADAPDLAAHFIAEFFGTFAPLGVGAETYRMRDVYASGAFDAAIDAVLRHADDVRRVYREVSGSVRPEGWLPLQVICEHCGRIATTVASDYDGETVAYRCEAGVVSWASGCGSSGRVPPFGGRAKLPWKLEWVAKWHVFGVTIEGAGKDHTTRGGSRDVSAACLRAVFGEEPPLSVPYEFFLVGGRKMSSSRGRGVALGDMMTLLPPDLLRFVMLRVPPRRAVDFEPDLPTVSRLFDDYDRLVTKVATGAASGAEVRLHQIAWSHPSAATPVRPMALPPFDTVVSVVQLPHVDTVPALERGLGRTLDAQERRVLDERVAAARTWLQAFAEPDDRIELQADLPASAAGLPERARAALHVLADLLQDCPWRGDAVQAALFDAARCTPLSPKETFAAVYRVFLDRDSGPRAGYLLAFLDRHEVLVRLRALPYDENLLWHETALTSVAAVEAWAADRGVGLVGSGDVGAADGAAAPVVTVRPVPDPTEPGAAGAEVDVVDGAGRRHRVRVRAEASPGGPSPDGADLVAVLRGALGANG